MTCLWNSFNKENIKGMTYIRKKFYYKCTVILTTAMRTTQPSEKWKTTGSNMAEERGIRIDCHGEQPGQQKSNYIFRKVIQEALCKSGEVIGPWNSVGGKKEI